MVIAYTKQEVKTWRYEHHNAVIGFVPTMGALHKGHLALIEEAQKVSDLVVVSIFVNPLQFNNPSDFEKYPQTLATDIQLLKAAGVKLLFAPNAAEMYGSTATLTLDFGSLNQVMDGPNRPGHFSGVGLVVGKLFNIVQPTKAFFGLKDLQQVRVIERMVADLDMPLSIIPCPTIRESNGLALSSRNTRLTEIQRNEAGIIYQVLSDTASKIKKGTSISEALLMANSVLERNQDLITNTEYLQVVNAHSLQPIKNVEEAVEIAICIACFIGEVRLIDNLIFKV